VNECVKTAKDESRSASLRRKTPEAHDGLHLHDEGVVFLAREVGKVLQGPHPCDGVGELV
jgi:hypothetical protein